MSKYLTIHGHFYQPPREDPWTGRIEVQPSAWPARDWNARIYAECYGPNAWSRVLNERGQIESIVDNYEYYSFNIGPTLMSWIRRFEPEAYARIREADRLSVERLGHGNAIAQVYNHVIMPLASARDRETQLKWGIADFEEHFGRRPEAVWLAETAINMDVVVDLVREGIKYVILAPGQAARVRPLVDSGTLPPWTDVSPATLDVTKPYRVFPRDEHGEPLCDGHLDVFFYNGALSSAVSFEHLLRSGETFAGRIEGTYRPDAGPELCSVVTDGESYGHHEPFGDMCAAYLFSKELPRRGIEVVNFGWYLEHFPPKDEVELANARGEGSAWSCAHGVGRWCRDCGCQTGAAEGWNQKWRAPLRDGLNALKARLDEIFESEASRLSATDPWELRNDYVSVLVDEIFPERLAASSAAFLKRHLKKGLKPAADGAKLLRLLESQKYAMYAFTSCGWFFNDIEGIEPVQNLRYARRAIEMAGGEELRGELEELLLGRLREAVSNAHGLTGEQVYRDLALPGMPAGWRLAASALLDPVRPDDFVEKEVHGLKFEAECERHDRHFRLWNCRIADVRELVDERFRAVTLRDSFREECLVVFPGAEGEVAFPKAPPRLLRDVHGLFPGGHLVRLADAFPSDLQVLADRLAHDSFGEIVEEFRDFGERHNLLFGLLDQKMVRVAEHVREPLVLSIVADVQNILKKFATGFSERDIEDLRALHDRAEEAGAPLWGDWIKDEYGAQLAELVAATRLDSPPGEIQKVLNLIVAAELGGVPLDRNLLERIAWKLYPRWREAVRTKQPAEPRLVDFFGYLNFSVDFPEGR